MNLTRCKCGATKLFIYQMPNGQIRILCPDCGIYSDLGQIPEKTVPEKEE